MDILVPIDGSECSFAALAFATDLVDCFDATLDVVHVSHDGGDVADLVARAADVLADAGVDGEVEVVKDFDPEGVAVSTQVGRFLVDLVDERGYDHVVMGRHGGGRLERFVIGSCSEELVEKTAAPVTVVP